VELIAPHRRTRKQRTQDGRPLRRYGRRWKVERLFAWFQNFRRIVVRYERHSENFLGMLHLACCILLRVYEMAFRLPGSRVAAVVFDSCAPDFVGLGVPARHLICGTRERQAAPRKVEESSGSGANSQNVRTANRTVLRLQFLVEHEHLNRLSLDTIKRHRFCSRR
jgi:hypothetical protein